MLSNRDQGSKKTYRIPVFWQMYGHIKVEATTLQEAISYALGPECPLPEGSYVDDSIQVDVEAAKNLTGGRRYIIDENKGCRDS